MGLVQKVAEHIVHTEMTLIPAEVTQKAKLCILDAIGCGLYGREFEASRILLQIASEWGGRPEATIIGQGIKAPSAMAAKLNGVAIHVADFDDSSIYFRGHPSSVVLPAVAALCERDQRSGKDLLLSYILGVEIGGRLGEVMGLSHYEAGWHGTATIGTIASAAASAKILDLNEKQTAHALAIAASGACGIRENFGTMVKSLHAGQAASAGVLAALLAERGYEGSLSAFEGKSGFYRVYSGENEISRLADGLDEFYTVKGLMFKRYPSCAATHSALDGLENIMQTHQFSWERIEQIDCSVPPVNLTVLIHPEPRTGLEAKFSLPYCISAFLVHGKLDLSHFEEDALNDGRVRKLMKRVKVKPDKRLGELVRTKGVLAPTEIDVKLGNRTLSKMVLEAKGGASSPLPDMEIEEKFRICAGRALPSEKVNKVMSLINSLESIENITTLTAALSA